MWHISSLEWDCNQDGRATGNPFRVMLVIFNLRLVLPERPSACRNQRKQPSFKVWQPQVKQLPRDQSHTYTHLQCSFVSETCLIYDHLYHLRDPFETPSRLIQDLIDFSSRLFWDSFETPLRLFRGSLKTLLSLARDIFETLLRHFWDFLERLLGEWKNAGLWSD